MPQTDENRLAIDLNVLTAEPAGEYHAKAGEYLSSHQLMDFLHCPRLYRDKQLGLVEDEHTEAMAVGTAAHVRLLEGRAAFDEQFVVGAPINKTSGKPYHRNTKAFRTWAAKQTKPGIHPDDLEQIDNLVSGVAANAEAADLLLYGRSEGVLRTEYCGTPCQCRLDWVHPHRGIVEFKTTADL
ncbi:MAG: PD-(D/E)XK nuclease-like domain-containing protein, partial [Phycisphaerae bacterium]|nr:PD-(D/E)XK nuclease-like domain-containing protein [Phycisphaerae bacterium]